MLGVQAGRVDQHVDPTELLEGGGDRPVYLVALANVRGKRERGVAGRPKLGASSASVEPRRAATATEAPASANATAVARPIPLLAPKTITAWPSSAPIVCPPS
jgi:hypothetical protein